MGQTGHTYRPNLVHVLLVCNLSLEGLDPLKSLPVLPSGTLRKCCILADLRTCFPPPPGTMSALQGWPLCTFEPLLKSGLLSETAAPLQHGQGALLASPSSQPLLMEFLLQSSVFSAVL